MNDYYTYAYLRKDGTPYYIGKGKGNRCNQKHGKNCNPPKDKNKIIKLKQNITEEEAFKHEIYMIAIFGKKCNGTGILMNISDGGNAPPVFYGEDSPTKRPEVRAKIGAANKKRLKGRKCSEESKRKQSNTWKEKLKNNPRPMSYYEENLKKMAERNRTDKEKHKKHSEFMRNQTFAAKPVEYDGIIYKSMTEAIEKTGISRYLILKRGGKFIDKRSNNQDINIS
jgi:hypothetical protein